VTIIEDVSDRIASESALRRQIEAQQLARSIAENALRAKDEFLSTLSHEIRTPLNAVLGWARILIARDEIDRNLLDRALRVIERNASAQARMIDDMLDMARIASGKLRLDMRPVDVVKVVLAAVDVIMPSAHAKHVALRTNLDVRTPSVLGDQDRLQQVIWNLLSNALKFTEPGGTIGVRLALNGRFVRIVVTDTENVEEKDKVLYQKYFNSLAGAKNLLDALDVNNDKLEKMYRQARKGKKSRTIVNASLGAMTGLSPLVLPADPVQNFGGNDVVHVSAPGSV